jgi:porin
MYTNRAVRVIVFLSVLLFYCLTGRAQDASITGPRFQNAAVPCTAEQTSTNLIGPPIADAPDIAECKIVNNELNAGGSRDAIRPEGIVESKVASKPREIVQDLAQHGISFPVSLVSEVSGGFRASPSESRWFARDLFNASMAMNLEKTLGWKGSSALVRLSQHSQRGEPDSLGEAQEFSNIGGSGRTSLYELWFQQTLSSNKLRLKAGKIDATTEFAAVQSAGDFLNSSMGYSPTILGFPTYPEPKPGVNIFFNPVKSYGLSLGVFQTAGMGILSIAEPARTWTTANDHPGRVGLGYWRLDGTCNRFDGSVSSVTQGFYGVLEQSLWRGPLPGGTDRNLSVFFQFGHADGSVSPLTEHLGGGLVMQSPLSLRPHDSAGIAVTEVRFSDHPAAGFDENRELGFEAYYKLQIKKPLALIPDFQFLHHPGGSSSEPDVPVLSQRLAISF